MLFTVSYINVKFVVSTGSFHKTHEMSRISLDRFAQNSWRLFVLLTRLASYLFPHQFLLSVGSSLYTEHHASSIACVVALTVTNATRSSHICLTVAKLPCGRLSQLQYTIPKLGASDHSSTCTKLLLGYSYIQ